VTRPRAPRPPFLRGWLIWAAGFLAFPLAGLAGTAVAGRVNTPVAALLGGAVTGLVIGAGQAVASSRRLDPRRWIPASAAGMSLGLLLGATTVDYRTSLADLALMGALTGLVLGVAQAVALPRRTHRRWIWAAALPLLWALGWTATTLGRNRRRPAIHRLRRLRRSHLLRPVRAAPPPTPAAPRERRPGSSARSKRGDDITTARHTPVAARAGHPLTESRGHHTPSNRGANNGSMSGELLPAHPAVHINLATPRHTCRRQHP
jgi:hypothetical protein